MTALEWVAISLGYVAAGYGMYVVMVPRRYRHHLTKHEKQWCHIGQYSQCDCRVRNGSRSPKQQAALQRELARDDAGVGGFGFAIIWPLVTLWGVLWLLGKGIYLGVLRPLDNIAMRPVDRAEALARFEEETKKESA